MVGFPKTAEAQEVPGKKPNPPATEPRLVWNGLGKSCRQAGPAAGRKSNCPLRYGSGATSVALNPQLRWVPSQNGRFPDCPQRHKATAFPSGTA